jgi:hypothetical protein
MVLDRRLVSADHVCKGRTDYSPATEFAGGANIGDLPLSLQHLDGYPVDLDVARVPAVSLGG